LIELLDRKLKGNAKYSGSRELPSAIPKTRPFAAKSILPVSSSEEKRKYLTKKET
jgi:hypothetical protein